MRTTLLLLLALLPFQAHGATYLLLSQTNAFAASITNAAKAYTDSMTSTNAGNWSASGTTNATLAGVASAYGFLATNGLSISPGDNTYATPGIHVGLDVGVKSKLSLFTSGNGTTGDLYGIYNNTGQTTTHTGGQITGFRNAASVTYSGAGGNLIGIESSADMAGTGSVADLYGSVGNVGVSGGTVTHAAMGVYSDGSITGGSIKELDNFRAVMGGNAGSVLDYKGFFLDNPQSSGSQVISNIYGLYISPLTQGVTANWGVYTAGTTPSHFGGNVEIAGTASANAGVFTNTLTLGGNSVLTNITKAQVTNALAATGSSADVLLGNGNWGVVAFANTTNSLAAPGDTAVYLNGRGLWATPTGGGTNFDNLNVTNTATIGTGQFTNFTATHLTVSDITASNTLVATTPTGTAFTNGYYSAVTNALGFAPLSTGGGGVTGPVTTTSSTTNGPAWNEFTTGEFVRNIARSIANDIVYNSGVAAPTAFDANTFEMVGVLPANGSRTYASGTLANGSYFGSLVSTQTYLQVIGPTTVSTYLSSLGGSGASSYTVKAELYYTYDTNSATLLGDYESGLQTIAHGTTTNRFDFVLSHPPIVSTNSTGFYLVRRLKVGVKTGTDDLIVSYGTNTPSQIGFSTPSATILTFSGVTNALSLTGATNRFLNGAGALSLSQNGTGPLLGSNGGLITNATLTSPTIIGATVNKLVGIDNSTAFVVPGTAAMVTNTWGIFTGDITKTIDGTGTLAGKGDIQTLNFNNGQITNNLAILLVAGNTNIIDVGVNSHASVTNYVTQNTSFAYATNGADNVEVTKVHWLRNYAGSDVTFSIPSGWITNKHAGPPVNLTNNTWTKMICTAIGNTSSAANQTNVLVSFEFY